MKTRIKYNNTVVEHQKKQYQFTNFTRDLKLIPDEFFGTDMYNNVFVEDDLTFELCSEGIYKKTDYWDLLMLYNNITNPLVLPKSAYIIDEIVDTRLNNWLSRYLLKGNDLDIPDITIKDNVWYIFVPDQSATDDTNADLIQKVASINMNIDNLAKELSNMETEYETIKDDSSDYGGYKRKLLRTDINSTRDKIFKFQQDIMDIEEEGIDIKGKWNPIRQKDLDKILSKNASIMVQQVYTKLMNDALKENEKYRYLKFPKIEYIARMLDYINKGIE
jgi:uncharacterized protein YoxC